MEWKEVFPKRDGVVFDGRRLHASTDVLFAVIQQQKKQTVI